MKFKNVFFLNIFDSFPIQGCDMLLYPAAFNMTTGPLHWELLQRGRANDLQLFVATVSPGIVYIFTKQYSIKKNFNVIFIHRFNLSQRYNFGLCSLGSFNDC